MKEFVVEQLTPEWFELKHGKIGGSSVASLMANKPVEDLALFNEIVADLCEDYEHRDGFLSYDMERGLEMEPEAVEVVEEHLGIEFDEIGWCEHDSLKLVGISPDRFSKDRKTGLEIKCPAGKTHVGYLREGVVPSEYFWQIIQYFVVNKQCETVYFASYRPENQFKQLFLKKVELNDVMKFKIGRTAHELTVSEIVEMVETKAAEFEKAVFEYVDSLQF